MHLVVVKKYRLVKLYYICTTKKLQGTISTAVQTPIHAGRLYILTVLFSKTYCNAVRLSM